ncbi:MAG: metal ABC transporter permease [Candidatus Sumerlaeaceae bacterium]|nr:metal ABC transporter permease [Candidatus Sumerlaeaceae bacterium]
MPNILTSMVRDFIEYEFWRNAVLGGLIVSVVCSLLSVYVVLRKMAFIGQGISHSAFGGVALGALLFAGTAAADAKIFATALVFCLAVAFLIAATTQHSRVSEDSAIGIFFVVSMALGVIFFKMAKGYNQDVFSFLFGSIVALTRGELVAMAIMALCICVPLLLLQKELLYYTFDEDMAGVSGIPVRFLHYFLLGVLSVTIVLSVRMVGIVLISAFLILPGATANLLATRFNRMVVLSVLCGVVTTMGGLALSWTTDWPTGAAIVIVQFALFLVVFAIRKIQGNLAV